MKSLNINNIPEIDHLRFFAALLVFSFHLLHYYFAQWKPWPDYALIGFLIEGHTGVALFFVLSGFLFMSIAMNGSGIQYGQFLRNRFLRIFPLFIFFFYISISVGRDDFRAADILYVFFSNIGLAPTSNSFITGAAWTISVEFTFYLVFPFLAKFSREEGVFYLLRIIGLLLLVKLAAYGVSQRPTHMFYSTLVGRFDQFLWGMMSAMLWQRYRITIERYGRRILILGVILIWSVTAWLARYASYFNNEPRQAFWIFWGTMEALVWSIVILGYIGGRVNWPQSLSRALSLGGTWSYSFYLWHGIVLYVTHRYFGVWSPFDSVIFNAIANFVLLLPTALVISALSYSAIERPFLRMRGEYIISHEVSSAK